MQITIGLDLAKNVFWGPWDSTAATVVVKDAAPCADAESFRAARSLSGRD